ncbi:MAG: GGDEF domain-containing protein [Erysipelotrichaceae bacterium]
MNRKEVEAEIQILKQTFDEVRLVNPFTLEVTSDQDAITSPCHAFWNQNQRCKQCISMQALQHKEKKVKFEFVDEQVYFVIARVVDVDGEPMVLEMLLKVQDNVELLGAGMNAFVDQIIVHNDKIYRDALSGAYNRRYLMEKTHIFVEENKHVHRDFGLAVVDVDRFKAINDEYGHRAGDEVIQKISVFFNQCLSDCAHQLIRFGGDEFVILFEDASNHQIEQYVMKLHCKLQELQQNMDHNNVTLSIGLAHANELEEVNLQQLLDVADARLYELKKEK